MNLQEWARNIVKDVKTDLTDEFDRNFERKGFFDEKWKETEVPVKTGSLMMRSGNLRNSIQSRTDGERIIFSSSLPYASIHNNGGEITVTAKMKKFFWAKHIEARDAGDKDAAEDYKAFALMKLGQKIKMKKRQFIGNHPEVNRIIEEVLQDNMQELQDIIRNNIQP
ncbi:phage virion morphogenesis protein [Chryseobacterium sp. MFBS3-17]|uniref:phage virion morphogenesis protein n=1 Tax=Chryseobacterium sp. MFBS3-17 TaxID=2886689 RepID=UPI001D0F2017|nr:phage virion morphogenesis protein [Chryseobacterium sp. MFBS3-17]MCC2590346.1 phage virion morphogenesis protein [Chryseobacterium sp. MFBS3-17]